MVNLIENEFCKICEKKGEVFFSASYADKRFMVFFENFYGQEKSNLIEKKLYNTDYVLLYCGSCNFLWQKYAPNNEFSYELYENIIDKDFSFNKSILKFNNNRKNVEKEFNFLSNYFNSQKINILDFGAGWGAWLRSIKNLQSNIFAYELSETRIKFLKNEGIRTLDEKSIMECENFFHFIRLDQVLEHLDDLKRTMEIIKKIAHKNCIIYISVPNGKKIINKKNQIKIEKGPTQPLEHLNCFSRESLKKLFDKNGFKEITLIEQILMHLKNFKFSKVDPIFILKDIIKSSFSTTIKFKLK